MLAEDGSVILATAENRGKLGQIVNKTQTETNAASLRAKVIHGVDYTQIENLGLEHCSRWLVDGFLSPSDEAKILVAQDGTLKTRKYCAEVLKEQVSPVCRLCKNELESVGHILSACEKHKFTLYKSRHDEALRPVVKALCTLNGIISPKPRKGVPHVLENDRVKILWDPLVVTLQEMSARRPDLLVFFKEKKKLVTVEKTCPWEARMRVAYQEKCRKYMLLAQDLKAQYPGWKVRQCTLVMGVLGSFEKDTYVKELTELFIEDKETLNNVLSEVQRATLMGSNRVIKNHLAEYTNDL